VFGVQGRGTTFVVARHNQIEECHALKRRKHLQEADETPTVKLNNLECAVTFLGLATCPPFKAEAA
jgi:hypothetical protein